jgi:hypothetical protein
MVDPDRLALSRVPVKPGVTVAAVPNPKTAGRYVAGGSTVEVNDHPARGGRFEPAEKVVHKIESMNYLRNSVRKGFLVSTASEKIPLPAGGATRVNPDTAGLSRKTTAARGAPSRPVHVHLAKGDALRGK